MVTRGEDRQMKYEVVVGTPGLFMDDVAHVLIPGRGRDATGGGLTAQGMTRVDVAALLLTSGSVTTDGVVVCAGYKSPSDRAGERWRDPHDGDRVFVGSPEADLMKNRLMKKGVPEARRRRTSATVSGI
jgi:hypothetical protein